MSQILKTRSTFMGLIEVTNANPNGDPDSEGRPRVRSDGRGWISAVSIKRKIRDLFDDHESLAFNQIMQELKISNPEEYHVFESLKRGSNKSNRVEANDWAKSLLSSGVENFLKRYIDVRQFGTTCLFEKSNAKEGDELTLIQTGVISIANAVSVCPILTTEGTQTKKATLRQKLAEIDSTDIAPMSVKTVNHGLYIMEGVVNPNVAKHTMTTEADIAAFKMALKHAFSASMSVTRPAAQISFVHLWWADHTKPLGSFNERNFFNKLRPVRNGSTDESSNSINDYCIPKPDFEFEVSDLAN